MKIQFFETKEGFDNRAIKGGVYQIQLKGYGKIISLYIGESVWITERCGQHLYALYLEFLWMRPDGAGYQLNVNDWNKR